MGGVGRTVVETEAELPAWDWEWECHNLREAWPYLTTTWLRTAEPAIRAARPFHTVAHRLDNETAVLPGYVYEGPADVDFDPRTYLGWQPATGQQACCSGAQAEAGAREHIEALGPDPFFPTLVLGSPLGYRSEVAFTFWNPDVFRLLVDGAVKAALAQGVRTVVAPWIPRRVGNQYLIDAMEGHGAATGLWGVEDYLRLTADSYEDHVAALPARRRRRLTEDHDRTARTGLEIVRLDRQEMTAAVPRLAELVALSREKYGANDRPEDVEAILGGLPAAGVDVRCWVARRGRDLLGSSIGIRKADQIYIKWVGFDYEALGEHRGVYFTLMFESPVRDAFTDGVRAVEFGMGSHEAKVQRNCESRPVAISFLAADPTLRPPVKELLAAFTAQREAAFGVTAQDASCACH